MITSSFTQLGSSTKEEKTPKIVTMSFEFIILLY